jgi:hypothetical protein
MLSVALNEELDARGSILDINDSRCGSEIYDIPRGLVLSPFAFYTNILNKGLIGSTSQFQRELQGPFWFRAVLMSVD